MSKPINTYKDLLEEKERLEMQMKTQRELIRSDIRQIKAEMKPAFAVMAFIGKLTTRDDNNPLIGRVANSLIDVVLKKVVLSRAGWIPKLIIPLFAKNASSHYFAENKDKFFKKLFQFIGHKNGKHHSKKTAQKKDKDL